MTRKAHRDKQGEAGRVRIIGGEWRSRILRFPAVDGLRPTGDRQRETLFNWLQQQLPGSRVIDLFAGSGALGFEAASRGAASVHFVESDRAAIRALRENAAQLEARQVTVVEADAWRFLEAPSLPCAADLVFVDPPFGRVDYERLLDRIAASPAVAAGARIYLETPAENPLHLPPDWQCLRERSSGAVRMQLLELPRSARD